MDVSKPKDSSPKTSADKPQTLESYIDIIDLRVALWACEDGLVLTVWTFVQSRRLSCCTSIGRLRWAKQ